MGGDEFAVLLEGLGAPEQAATVASDILASLRQPFFLENREVYSSASIGVALGSTEYQLPDEILRDADTAMYTSKAKGKAQLAIFDATMGERAKARLESERDLRHALERHEFFLEYQPIVLLSTGKVTGFEALVRWRHPQRGVVPPSEFIPIAEETGLIVSIGRWVLAEACRQMALWNQRFEADPMTIAVNLSGKQLLQGSLLADVAEVLRQSCLPPECLHLEVTESTLMEDTEAVIEILAGLKHMGIGLDIDDFGTGYSSLSYLYRLPFGTLKIDRSFVANMDSGEEGSAIVKTIVNLARNLRMHIIAEGIENRHQWRQLATLSCTHGQGFHISRPLGVAAAGKFIESNRTAPLPEPIANYWSTLQAV